MPSEPPPQPVLAAFGAAGVRLVPFGGGQATSRHAGGLVLKPADLDRAELEWQAQVSSQVSCDGFRLAQPRAAAHRSLCVRGRGAPPHLPGHHYPPPRPQILALIFRAVTDWILAKDAPAASGAGDDPWAPAVDLACQLAARA